VEHAAAAGYEIVQKSIDQAELRQIYGVLIPGDYGLMAIACRDDVEEASKAIREHGTAGRQGLLGPETDRFGTEAKYRRCFGVNRATSLVKRNGSDDWILVL
jgi:hypothetical protein